VSLVTGPGDGSRAAILVDCVDSVFGIVEARQAYPGRPLVGVLATLEPGRIIEALASGADGVIALNDPPAVWRECLNVVLGGARWLGGPGVEVSLHDKHASYDIAKSERHSGDVTTRTQIFVKKHLGDKLRS
jgi:DNA-binding NarL/FixJ family response regulator